MPIHKQVKYNDSEVDKEFLPIIKKLNDNGITTRYSCCGLGKDNNKDKTMLESKGDIYIVFDESDKSVLFAKTLMIVHNHLLFNEKKDNKYFMRPILSLRLEFSKDHFIFILRGEPLCTFNLFVGLIEQTLRVINNAKTA